MEESKLKADIAENWNAESMYYDSHVSHGIATEEEKRLWMEAFNAVLPKNDNLRILDVGCGTGAMGLILSEMGHEVSGIDLSEGMMEVGRRKAAEHDLSMTFTEGDAEYPPFSDDTFDVVVNRHLLWTLPHPATALENWFRITKPGGVVLVIDGVWDDGSSITKARRKVSDMLAHRLEAHPHGKRSYSEEVRAALPHKGGVSPDVVRTYFAETGLEEVACLDLKQITENQCRQLPWYRKIMKMSSYYLMAGSKPICVEEEGVQQT